MVVSAPFFLQALLVGPYLEIESLDEWRGTFAEVSHAIYVSDRDKAFAEDICPDSSKWWDVGRPCDFKSLSNLVFDKLEQV